MPLIMQYFRAAD